MTEYQIIAVLIAAGLALASAWVNFVLHRGQKEKWSRLEYAWSAVESSDEDGTAQAQTLCRRLREMLAAPYCSLWVHGPQSGMFRPIAHDGSPLQQADSEAPTVPSPPSRATIPGEVPSEIVSRAWTTGDFQEWGSGGQRWVVHPVSPRLEGGGAIVIRLGDGRRPNLELLRAAAVPAAVIALRLGHDRELSRTRRELDDIRAEMIEESKLAAVGRLAAGVAHELNTPLGAVLTMVGSLSRNAKDADIARRLGIVREGVEKCKSIIEKLLVFSRGPVETEEGLTFSRFVRAPMELNRVIREAVELLAEPLVEEGIKVTAELGEIPPIRANSTQWGQVLTNLLANARDAFRSNPVDGPTITVRTLVDGNHIVLEVADNGPGIPPAVVGRIFDPFFTTKEIGKGTGLGLAIVREIVKKHDGTIDVQTAAGQGTTFRIRVPAGTAQRMAAAAQS
jgi:signal transduction histidine kinase